MISEDMETELAQIEGEIGARDFAAFAQMAWPQIEPVPLHWGWGQGAIAEHCQAVEDGQIQNLLTNVPPGSTKSALISILFPAWVWARSPERAAARFICSTYAQPLSNTMARKSRDLIASDWYRARWPHVILGAPRKIKGKRGLITVKSVQEFENTLHGWRFSTSVGGRATGMHGNYLLFDDLVKAQDAEGRAAVDMHAIEKANEFWLKTMATRQADARTTRRIGVMQRLHDQDTAGRILEEQRDKWTHLKIPMRFNPADRCVTSIGWSDPRTEPGELLDPVRYPEKEVRALETAMGSRTAAAQLQQDPVPAGGAIFHQAWIKRWVTRPERARTIITVDCSFKEKKSSDWVAIHAWANQGPNYFLLDRMTGQWGVKRTLDGVREMRERFPHAGVHVEDKANGPAVIEIMKGDQAGIVEWSPGTASKESRAEAVAPLFEGGNVFFPPDSEAPWVADVVKQLVRFPMAKHDDDVDACTMALLILHRPFGRKYAAAVRAMRTS